MNKFFRNIVAYTVKCVSSSPWQIRASRNFLFFFFVREINSLRFYAYFNRLWNKLFFIFLIIRKYLKYSLLLTTIEIHYSCSFLMYNFEKSSDTVFPRKRRCWTFIFVFMTDLFKTYI